MEKSRIDTHSVVSASDCYARNVHRQKFLQAVERIPAADVQFRQLARDAKGRVGASLDRVIENWAVDCHLAKRPAKSWWIFNQVSGWLAALAGDPPSFNMGECGEKDTDEDADQEEIRQDLLREYYSYSSVDFGGGLEELPFRLYAYDPYTEKLDDYVARARKSFATYLDTYVSRQPTSDVPETRELSHYEWLVRHQMLNQRYRDIADSVHRAESTIHTEVNELRKLVRLPAPRRGRPKKKMVGRL